MFVDSSPSSEGLLDTRLISDLAAIQKLEELEVCVWGGGGPDSSKACAGVQGQGGGREHK